MTCPALPVIFRSKRENGSAYVTAVFPTLPGTRDPATFTVYVRVGQHGTGCRNWYLGTRPARPREYADLLAELRRIYEQGDEPVVLRVVQRITQKHDNARKAALA